MATFSGAAVNGFSTQPGSVTAVRVAVISGLHFCNGHCFFGPLVAAVLLLLLSLVSACDSDICRTVKTAPHKHTTLNAETASLRVRLVVRHFDLLPKRCRRPSVSKSLQQHRMCTAAAATGTTEPVNHARQSEVSSIHCGMDARFGRFDFCMRCKHTSKECNRNGHCDCSDVQAKSPMIWQLSSIVHSERSSSQKAGSLRSQPCCCRCAASSKLVQSARSG
jgi:hypothetical protein